MGKLSNYELQVTDQIDRLRASVDILLNEVNIATDKLVVEEEKLELLIKIHEKAKGNDKVDKKKEGGIDSKLRKHMKKDGEPI